MTGVMSGCKAAARSSNCARVITVLQSAVLWDTAVELDAGFAVLLAAGVSQIPWTVITGSLAPTWPAKGAGTGPLGLIAVALFGVVPGAAGTVTGTACPSAIEVKARIVRLRKRIVCSLRSYLTCCLGPPLLSLQGNADKILLPCALKEPAGHDFTMTNLRRFFFQRFFFPHRVDRGIHQQLENERRDNAADHRSSHALHDFRSCAGGPQDGNQPDTHGGKGHELGTKSLRGSLNDGLVQSLLCQPYR